PSPLLSVALCLTANYAALAQNIPSVPNSIPAAVSVGNQITINGRTLPGAWLQPTGNQTYISDGAVKQLMGIDLLSSNNPSKQPIQWFSALTNPIILNTKISGGYRYLDISKLAITAKWQIKANGNTLVINPPPSQLRNIRLSKQPKGDRIVLDLDNPTFWQIRQELPVKKVVDPDEIIPKSTTPANREWTVTLNTTVNSDLLAVYNPKPPIAQSTESPIQKIETVNNQTIINLSIPFGQSIKISTLSQPNRLVIDIQPETIVQRTITWAQGLQWRQQ
ncbi:MAG: hypothetical protein ACKN9K_21625, partial [Dolichospermum sp.]